MFPLKNNCSHQRFIFNSINFSADPQFQSSVINTNVIVSSNGEVVWLSHGIYRSSCDINVEYFPFDLQSCQMKWASWTYDGYQVSAIFLYTEFNSQKKSKRKKIASITNMCEKYKFDHCFVLADLQNRLF